VKRFVVAVCVSVFLASPFATAAPSGSSSSTGTARTGAAAAVRIENFGAVNDRYYRGAQPAGRDYADLAALGVRTVIDLTLDGEANEERLVKAAGMRFYRIPLTTSAKPASNDVSRFLEIVNDPANQPVYVHCVGGHHRTGVMTAVYRMTQDGWTADQAYKEMQEYGFGPAFLHSALKSFVYDFYDRMPKAPAVPQGLQPQVAADSR
jgi:protein tyrosine/serine phosphatase